MSHTTSISPGMDRFSKDYGQSKLVTKTEISSSQMETITSWNREQWERK